VAGVALSGNLVGGVFRVDFSESFTHDADAVTSLLVNFDRSWVWGGKNLYGFLEYFRNGFGQTSFDQGLEGLDPRLLDRLARGEVFNLGRDELAAGLRFEWTPLTSLEPSVLVNPRDPSAYLLLHLHHDWSENVSLDAGVQLGLGPRSTEYGGLYSSDLDSYLAPGRTFWARVARYF
jgi:hypothetical protein